ncbi:LOW QUALITY PROTEIN: proline-rich basic protein 1 [Crotalus tigris]|uniref:LOW QUALITY PROTEIN: proline-rich basic protein 1 n=1 Tax=Crotalus tigris TaxID=88082 RepID=UPI00192F1375|nr:LOW QUALITY PROTEIN: proline-rich basic protein 1 [Crotalus tigris]
MVSTAPKMFSSLTSKSPFSFQPEGLNEEKLSNYSGRVHSALEKEESHVSGNCTSDTSSSYRSAPSSEEAESFKDCIEYLEEAGGDRIMPCTYCDAEYEQALLILSADQTKLARKSRLPTAAARQPHKTLNDFSNSYQEKGNGSSATSGDIQVHFPPNKSKTLGGSVPVQGARVQSLQAELPSAIKDQNWRDKLCSSGKESQQVQVSIKANNSSDPVCGRGMGLVTPRLQPGDSSGSKYLDHPAQFSADKSKEMLPSARKLKKSSLGSRPHGPVSSQSACPRYFVENSSVLSDSEEADNEVEKLTAGSFRSLSCPQGSYLDMYSSSNGTSSSLSNSVPEDWNGMNRWPACSDPRKTMVVGHSKGNRPFPPPGKAPETELLSGVLGKEHFECIDLRQENADGKKSLSKKRMVPKRQIQLRRKDKKETGFCPPGEPASVQSFTQPRKDPSAKGRNISDEFRINYKQFLKAASLGNAYSKTRLASDLVKNVLAKKLQYEQRIKMEQVSIQDSSPSSVPSSISTDLQGDSIEGKSSSLSKSDCSFSTEDVQSQSTPSERSASIAISEDSRNALRPTKGVVLNKQLRENVYKLKNTFNELNERMKYQEDTPLNRLPVLAEDGVNVLESSNVGKQASGERQEYWRARAVFEAMQDDPKTLPLAPKFAKSQKPWPNLKQRAIQQKKVLYSKDDTFPSSLAVPKDTSRNTFISKTKEMKLIPQMKNKHSVPNAFRPTSWDRGFTNKRMPTFQSMKLSSIIVPASGKFHNPSRLNCPKASFTEGRSHMPNKGNVRTHQSRDVRKIVKETYNLGFKPTDDSSADQSSCAEKNENDNLTGFPKESTAISPLFIHCTSICRKDYIPAGSHMQEKKQDQTEGLDMSTLSLQEASTKESSDNFHPIISNKCSAIGDSGMHIATIQSKKLAVRNKEFQPLIEKKLVLCERSELNVRPASTPTKKESQLNIKVNSSISKPPHTTATDYFPCVGYSTVDDRTNKKTRAQFNHSLLRENKAVASSEIIVIPPSAYVQEISMRENNCSTRSRMLDPCKVQEAESSYQKHRSCETLSVGPKDGKGYSVLSKEENIFSDSLPSCVNYRHLHATRAPGINTPNLQMQTPTNNQYVDRLYETTALEDRKPLDSHHRIHSESIISDNPLTAREYMEGIKLVSNSMFTPKSSGEKVQDSGCDYFNNSHQATNEQYFSTTQADNTNYLTIPVKTHPSEPDPKQLPPLHMDNTSFTSNISFQPGVDLSGNKMSNEFFPSKQMERKTPSDNFLYSAPSLEQLPLRHEESPSFTRRNERVSPLGKSAPSPTRHFAAPLQAHRKMLVDPESGKCYYYVESPRQPQLKMLYDPETGQYIEVLIPPTPLPSHSGLYQPPFPSMVMNPGIYGQPYMSYSGCPGFPPPPAPPGPLDLQDQLPVKENANFSDGFNHFAKHEAPSAPDGNYMESLYYIPTGMNSSPNPSQALYSPSTSSAPLPRM